ncbi:hypothetical protein LN893_18260 [Pontibacter sp. XAAS-A31]|nr:hypothetical protein [Pontibacter harenae]
MSFPKPNSDRRKTSAQTKASGPWLFSPSLPALVAFDASQPLKSLKDTPL